MFHYYQRHEKDAWFAIPYSADTDMVALALQNQATKLTILTVNQLVADGDDPEVERNRDKISYRGPLYFDIDCKNDLAQAIASGNELVKRLLDLGTPEAGIEIYLSGSKGVHVLVDERLFSSARFTRRLPEIYKEMARDLFVAGLDYSVYSGGRGNSFRIPNVKRHDGNYRVPVTVEELKVMEPELYRKVVSEPRTIHRDRLPEVQVPELMALFEDARRRVNSKQKVVLIATSGDLEKIKFEPPTCIQMLCDGKHLKNDTTFNQVATQLAAYAVRAGVSETILDSLAARAAENNHSSKYNTFRKRREHIEAQIRYVEHTPSFSFGCNAIRALLAKRPCDGCAIEDSSSNQGDDSGGISADACADGYYVGLGESRHRVTNFILQPHDVFIEVPQDGTSPRRTGTRMAVLQGGVEVGSIFFRESAFGSRSGFLREIEGIKDLTFQGSDLDVQRIKIAVYKEDQEVGEVFQVYTCGIHLNLIGDEPVFTYVEPDLSVNSLRVTGTHQYLGTLQARPWFSKVNIPETGDLDTDLTIVSMLNMNHPVDIGKIVGWSAACHLREHLQYLYNQFPVLLLHGAAGAGKSITAGLVTWMNGTDYMSQDSGVNCPSASHYGMIDYTSSTTTVPRILEEYNKSKMSASAYRDTGERIKQSWGRESALRGKPSSKTMGRVNAESVMIPISSPLIVMSEQELDMPAILERGISIHLTKNKRANKRAEFEFARKNRNLLRQFGKALMSSSLGTTLEEVEDLMNKASSLLPETMDDRPRYSLQVLLVGLWKMREVLMQLELHRSTDALNFCIGQILAKHGKASGSYEGHFVQSEIDLVLGKMAIVIALAKSAEEAMDSRVPLREGINYGVTPEYLVLDPILCHAAYASYVVSQERSTPVIDSAAKFLKLVKEEPYFVAFKPYSGMGNGRDMLFLSLRGLHDKGIDVTLVTGGSDEYGTNAG